MGKPNRCSRFVHTSLRGHKSRRRPRPGYLNRRKLAHLGSSPPRGLGVPVKTHHWLSKRPRRSLRRPENFILRERNIASGARCLLAEKCKDWPLQLFRPKVAANGTVKFKQPLDAPAQLQRRLGQFGANMRAIASSI